MRDTHSRVQFTILIHVEALDQVAVLRPAPIVSFCANGVELLRHFLELSELEHFLRILARRALLALSNDSKCSHMIVVALGEARLAVLTLIRIQVAMLAPAAPSALD